jgi:hypothetical protein
MNFLHKHKKAIEFLEQGYMSSYGCKICNFNKNTIIKNKTKIVKEEKRDFWYARKGLKTGANLNRIKCVHLLSWFKLDYLVNFRPFWEATF